MNVSDQVNAAIQERARKQHERSWTEFVNRYGLNLLFPAKISSKVHPDDDDDDEKGLLKKNKRAVKTNKDLLNARLLENGFLFQDLQTLPELQLPVSQIVDNLMRTGCFNSVQVEIGLNENGTNNADETATTSSSNEQQQQQQQFPHTLELIVDEKNWYSLYIGGGLKHDSIEESLQQTTNGNISKLPMAQFETSASLLNLTGYLDMTQFRYTIDQSTSSSFLLTHERPLYSWIGDDTPLGDYILALSKGSQYSLGLRALIDTSDYEWTRSYKEYIRSVTCRLDNTGRVTRPDLAPGYYWGLDWTLALRDVVPKKHSKLPYTADASHEVVAQSGPSLTHSLIWEVRTNGEYCNDRLQPTSGIDWHTRAEIAGPPGDVGFVKMEGGTNVHIPVLGGDGDWLSFHGSCSGGYLKPLSFAGLCRPVPTLSDRFYVGGPVQLRGFLPSGIGPRSSTRGGSTTPGGDSLGGTFYYTSSISASMAPTGLMQNYGIRIFSFANIGTLVGNPEGLPIETILKSSRASVGFGISAGMAGMGRFESSYAWPLRYGPKDARRNLQFSFGFNFG